MAIQGGRVQKKPHGKAKGKGKAKGGHYSYPSKTKKPQPQKKERPAKGQTLKAELSDISSRVEKEEEWTNGCLYIFKYVHD
nr:hypothetical protein [Tanacetum cinerariifolium]